MDTVNSFDIELVGQEPVAVGFFDGERYTDFLKEREGEDFLWQFLCFLKNERVRVVYAHDGKSYENKCVLNTLVSHGQRLSTDAGLISLTWIEGGIHFKDSHALLRMSLVKACEAFKIPYEIRPKRVGRLYREYLRRDTIALACAYAAFVKELFITFGLTDKEGPGDTLSLTALRIFKKFYPIEDIHPNAEFGHMIREALYPTRNEVYRRYGEDISIYDIRSMFVSCYDTPVPIGKMNWRFPRMDKGVIARAEVKIPESMTIGPLPLYLNGRLIFPTGEFEGWWDMVELRYAKEIGCKVKLVAQLEGEEEAVLSSFGKMICNLRSEASPELGKIWKQLGILLTGKFAQSRPQTTVRHILEIQEDERDGWEPLSIDSPYFIGNRKKQMNRSARPAITMRVRATARVKHHRILMEVLKQGGSLYYCDTDSVFCSQGIDLPVGENPGELKHEGDATRGYFLMNKFYAIVDTKGRLWQKSAGFRDLLLKEEELKILLDGESVKVKGKSKSLSSLKEIVRSGDIRRDNLKTVVRQPYANQNRTIDGLNTYPYQLSLKGERVGSGNITYKGA